MGAASKGGTTALRAVCDYAEPPAAKGLVFMDTPGFDPVSVSGMIAGGANLLAFTTGRGSVSGFKPLPTLKLASNSEMCRRLRNDMDLDCGPVLSGDATVETAGRRIYERVLAVASGRRTQSEKHGLGETDFVPWHFGPVT